MQDAHKFELLKYVVEGRVAEIVFNQPEKRNPLTDPLMQEYLAALDLAGKDDQVSVIILRGEGKCFASGQHLSLSKDTLEKEPISFSNLMQDIELQKARQQRRIAAWNCPKPVIAVVHGYNLAAALDIVMSCDIVMASVDCKFGHPGMRLLGSAPQGAFWPVLLGPHWAKRLLLTGDVISAKDAQRIGMVQHVLPASKLLPEARTLAKRMALIPLELLYYNKASINRAFEIMGLRSIQLSTVDYNAMSHQVKEVSDWFELQSKTGLKEALAERDKQFGDYESGKGRVPSNMWWADELDQEE
jgi:enoyl-CoA hydratase